MAVVGTLVDTLLRRVRDASGVATSRALTREFLTHAQRLVNASTHQVLATFQVTAQAEQTVYTLTGDVSTALRVEAIRFGNLDLKRVPWPALPQIDLHWIKAAEAQPYAFAEFGRDVFCLYPAFDDTALLDVVTVKNTDTLSADSVTVEMPDHEHPAMLDLAEALVSLRLRNFGPALAAIERLGARFVVKG